MYVNMIGGGLGIPGFVPPMKLAPPGLGDLPHVRTPVYLERSNGANASARLVSDLLDWVASQNPPAVLPDPPPSPATATLEAHRKGRMVDVAA